MLREGEEQLISWARDPVKSWNEFQLTLDKGLAADGGLVDKLNEDKLARDVDDLTAIFEDLADGADFALPVDELETDEVADAAAAASAWIDGLDDDAVNVNELSEAFDALVEEQDAAMESESATEDGSEEDEDMDSDCDDYSDEDVAAFQPTKVVHSAPVWARMAPLDPRSCIRGPVFQDLDPRIPRIEIPRMDLSQVAGCGPVKLGSAPSAALAAQSISPKHGKATATATAEYRHDPKTCWICKSSKTPEKKRALHRYLEKRSRRNWKRGPRYAGRSHVATSRVRNGGRFICTTRWI